MAREAQLTKQLPIAMTPEMYDRIQRHADTRKVSMGEVSRDALEAGLGLLEWPSRTVLGAGPDAHGETIVVE